MGVHVAFRSAARGTTEIPTLDILTTREAAKRLGVSPGRIRQLIAEGRLPARKPGRDLEILESDLPLVMYRPWGRRYPVIGAPD